MLFHPFLLSLYPKTVATTDSHRRKKRTTDTGIQRAMRARWWYLLVLWCVLQSVIGSIGALEASNNKNDIHEKKSNNNRQHKRWRGPVGTSSVVSTAASNTTEEKGSTENIETNSHHNTEYVAECLLPTIWGNFKLRSYRYSSRMKELEPIVIISGDVKGKSNVLVRVHDQCFTSEVFGSKRCDCREQLEDSLKIINKESGIIIYLQQEGRGIGIANKIAAYSLQDQGMDTVDANIHLGFNEEMREYYPVADILADLDIKSIRLMTNNPYKIDQLKMINVQISEQIPINVVSNRYNSRYLRSKRDRMNHTMVIDDDHSVVADEDCKIKENYNLDSKFIEINNKLVNVMDILPNKGYAFGRESAVNAINAIRNGEIVVVVDDENRENEGDLIMAAEFASPEKIGFIVRHSSGVLCASLESDRLEQLRLPPMVSHNEDPKQTAYTISVDCIHNTTTGISAADRAITFKALANPLSRPGDFQRPGHVFPLRCKDGGCLVRAGHTETSLDLARMAGLEPAAVLAEVVNDDGSIKKLPDLKVMAAHYGMVLTSVQDLIAYRYETELNKL